MVPADPVKAPVVVIAGPTASGKTALSLALASRYDGEIINADASQIRRDLDIGTAKTPWRDAPVRHHLFDIIGPDEEFSIRDYQKVVRPLLEEISARGRLPFLVGGSGLYINAALGDYDLSIPGRDPEFDRQFDSIGNAELHGILVKEDPLAAATIHPNNRRRVLRAIEAARAGKKVSENRAGRNLLYAPSSFACPLPRRSFTRYRSARRGNVYPRVDREVQNLIRRDVSINKIKGNRIQGNRCLPRRGSRIGRNKEEIKKTRRYAKRQLTWFRNQTDAVFIEPDYDDFAVTIAKVCAVIDGFLGGLSRKRAKRRN